MGPRALDEMAIRYECMITNTLWDIKDLYFCDGCNIILSKHPKATFEEIESYFCNGCLENLPSSDAINNMNRCSKCFDCPICQSTLSFFTFNSGEVRKYYLGCSYCRWNSKEGELVQDSIADITSVVIAREKDSFASNQFNIILQKYRSIETLENNNDRNKIYPWKWTDVEKDINNRSYHNISLQPNINEEFSIPNISPYPLDVLLRQPYGDINKSNYIMPLRKVLKTKRARRCVQCVNNGRSGILIKPQISPLHGDSSRVVDVGSWFKKQNSARNFVPLVSIVSINKKEILLRFTNPASTHLSPITSDISINIDVIEYMQATVKFESSSFGQFIIPSLDELDAENIKTDAIVQDSNPIVKYLTYNSLVLCLPFEFISTCETQVMFRLGIKMKSFMGDQPLNMNVITDYDIKL